MKQFCSLKDIASAAGVSTALVSYVLNGKLSAKIRPETATRIRNIAADLNYIPNHMASNLKSERTLTMGLVMADISNFYYSNLARIIEDECTRTGYNLIFGNADEHAGKFKEVVDFFIRRQVDGLILATPCGAEPQLKFLNKLKIPFIGIDRYFSSLKDVNTITIDNYKASHDVAALLAKLVMGASSQKRSNRKRAGAFLEENNLSD